MKLWKEHARVPLYGRSMVEMLGVLAIIGVLSVGAIAGYSQAMGKYRANQMINDYNHLIMNILEHHEDYIQLPTGTQIAEYLQKQDLLPAGFDYVGVNSVYDVWKNRVDIWSGNKLIILEIYFATRTQTPNTEACNLLIRDLFYPMRDSIEVVGLWRGTNAEGTESSAFQSMYYGDHSCKKSVKCLKDLTAVQIQKDCENVCENGRNCSIVVNF